MVDKTNEVLLLRLFFKCFDMSFSIFKILRRLSAALRSISVLLTNTMESAEGAVASFRGMADFLEWEIAGTVIGVNCGDVELLKQTNYLEKAYELGKII